MQNKMCAIGIIASPWRRACHSLESGWNERAQRQTARFVRARQCTALAEGKLGGGACVYGWITWREPGAKAEVPTYCQAERDPAASDATIVRDVRLARAPVCVRGTIAQSDELSELDAQAGELGYVRRANSFARAGCTAVPGYKNNRSSLGVNHC